MAKIETVEQLTDYINSIININHCMMPLENHGITFFLNHTLKESRALLQKKLNVSEWNDYSYRNEEENILITLNNMGGMTTCFATVMSLHLEYIKQFDH
ncbi:hypothetical protein B9037_025055 [Klebsiella aerogenes]|uniref:hypothetical protein n=1 Tax=Klebsiella aerogenes TaxID=548 RepID=UPI000B4121AB|nr:hypothetical protein [Klebsiella aerogenes]MEB7637049.1 hypothetical protein [Klebsiella aerogenes]RNT23648.1 hypothetical protein B9037_025055 [Klebsiella aerogenes]HDS4947938.1 hypothetical protein [Klebsiella aerogenes]